MVHKGPTNVRLHHYSSPQGSPRQYMALEMGKRKCVFENQVLWAGQWLGSLAKMSRNAKTAFFLALPCIHVMYMACFRKGPVA